MEAMKVMEEVEVAVAKCPGTPGQCGQAGEESLAGSPILTSSQPTPASSHSQPASHLHQLIVRQ